MVHSLVVNKKLEGVLVAGEKPGHPQSTAEVLLSKELNPSNAGSVPCKELATHAFTRTQQGEANSQLSKSPQTTIQLAPVFAYRLLKTQVIVINRTERSSGKTELS